MTSISLSNADGLSVITINGHFVFDINREFRAAYQTLPRNTPVTVDLSQSPYIDSAALGMLIRLREHAGDQQTSVTLKGLSDTVRTILDVANFGRLFTYA